MIPLLLSVVAFVNQLPCEYAVDCSGWMGRGRVEITYRYETRDGRVYTNSGEFLPGSDARTVFLVFTWGIRDEGWDYEKRGEPGRETAFVIRGSKTSQIKSVTFEGDTWAPTVQRRILSSPKEPKK